MTSPARKSEGREDRISLRATPSQRRVLEQAAEATGKTLTSFILDAASIEAQRALADRRVFLLDDEQWARFVEALDRPAHPGPRLRRLLTEPSILE